MSISTEIIPRAIPGLPSREVLAVLCSAHSYEHHKQNRVGISHFIYRPTKRRGLFKKRGTSEPLALIKFGTHVTLGEARTQIYVFQHLKRDPSPPFRVAEVYDAWEERVGGFIVMEYIPGLAATAMDGPRIAAAIHWLLALPPPDDGKLGPVGGGPMRHSLWRDDEGPTYESVEQMDTHLNNVLKYQGLTVNLSADPICFYHDDIDLRNFLVAGDHLYVIDFEHTGFAPASFMSYSLIGAFLAALHVHRTERQPAMLVAAAVVMQEFHSRYYWHWKCQSSALLHNFQRHRPLVNPARLRGMVLGITEPEIGSTIAQSIRDGGLERALVVCEYEKLDEISCAGPTWVWELKDGEITK
ncbi:hypothetical protein C0995_008415 [Termitomyces sp. Mi166|nr:hypothetical protein C0995_008415 [Termitomyces sp. Mi166\